MKARVFPPLAANYSMRSDEITTVRDLNKAILEADGTANDPAEIIIADDGITVDSTITINGRHVKLTGGSLTLQDIT